MFNQISTVQNRPLDCHRSRIGVNKAMVWVPVSWWWMSAGVLELNIEMLYLGARAFEPSKQHISKDFVNSNTHPLGFAQTFRDPNDHACLPLPTGRCLLAAACGHLAAHGVFVQGHFLER